MNALDITMLLMTYTVICFKVRSPGLDTGRWLFSSEDLNILCIVNAVVGGCPCCKELWCLGTSVLPCPTSMHPKPCWMLWWSESSLPWFRQPAGLAHTAVKMVSILCRVSSRSLLISLHHATCPRLSFLHISPEKPELLLWMLFITRNLQNTPSIGRESHPYPQRSGCWSSGLAWWLRGWGQPPSHRWCGEKLPETLQGSTTRAHRNCLHLSLCYLALNRTAAPTVPQHLAAVLVEQDPWAHVLAQPWPISILKEVPGAQCLGLCLLLVFPRCPAPGWGCGMDSTCQALPWGTPQSSWSTGSSRVLQQPGKI